MEELIKTLEKACDIAKEINPAAVVVLYTLVVPWYYTPRDHQCFSEKIGRSGLSNETTIVVSSGTYYALI